MPAKEQQNLEKLTKVVLVEMAKEHGVDHSGNKPDIVARLKDFFASSSDSAPAATADSPATAKEEAKAEVQEEKPKVASAKSSPVHKPAAAAVAPSAVAPVTATNGTTATVEKAETEEGSKKPVFGDALAKACTKPQHFTLPEMLSKLPMKKFTRFVHIFEVSSPMGHSDICELAGGNAKVVRWIHCCPILRTDVVVECDSVESASGIIKQANSGIGFNHVKISAAYVDSLEVPRKYNRAQEQDGQEGESSSAALDAAIAVRNHSFDGFKHNVRKGFNYELKKFEGENSAFFWGPMFMQRQRTENDHSPIGSRRKRARELLRSAPCEKTAEKFQVDGKHWVDQRPK